MQGLADGYALRRSFFLRIRRTVGLWKLVVQGYLQTQMRQGQDDRWFMETVVLATNVHSFGHQCAQIHQCAQVPAPAKYGLLIR